MCLLYTLLLQILNSYMSLIMDKHEDIAIHFQYFNLYQVVGVRLSRCMQLGEDTPIIYQEICYGIAAPQQSLVPCCHIDMVHCRIILHDSLPNRQQHSLLGHSRLLEAAKQNVAVKIWIKEVCKQCPQQSSFNNCGVYVCMNAIGTQQNNHNLNFTKSKRTNKT